jgi:bacterioferritin
MALDGNRISTGGSSDVKQTIEGPQNVLATEIVHVLRYTMNAAAASGLSSESVKNEFDEHATENNSMCGSLPNESTSWE